MPTIHSPPPPPPPRAQYLFNNADTKHAVNLVHVYLFIFHSFTNFWIKRSQTNRKSCQSPYQCTRIL